MTKLKCILAATDFSESAENAVDYAAALAEKAEAKLVILSAFHIPIVASEIPTLMFTLDELEKDGLQKLKETESRLRKLHPGLKEIELLSLHGFASEIIKSQAEKLKANLLVMGLQGSGFLNEKIIGSNSYEMVNASVCPVLIVPFQLRFQKIERLLYANNNRELQSAKVLEPIAIFAKLFQAKIYILHVNKNSDDLPDSEAAVTGIKLDHYFEGIKHDFYETQSENLVDGINAFAQEHNTDLCFALAHNYSFFEKIFKKNNVQNMMYHLNTPILIIHE